MSDSHDDHRPQDDSHDESRRVGGSDASGDRASTQPTTPLPQGGYGTDGPADGRYGDARDAGPNGTAAYERPAAGAPEHAGAAFGAPAAESRYDNPYVRSDGYNPYTGRYHEPQVASAAPAAAVPPTSTMTADRPQRRTRTGPVVAALVVGALIGGGAGGGVAYFAGQQDGRSSSSSTTSTTANGPTNITVNDPKNATAVTAVAAKASPSVVTINVTGSAGAGTGSGIVLTSDGYVLTNTHVVTLDGEIANAKVTVTTNDGKIYTAKVVGTDPVVDLAVIKLQGVSGLTPATFGNSDDLNVGDQAIAIGAPLGLSGTVTEGIVSTLNRSISIASSAAPKNNDESQGDGSGQSPFNFDLPGQGNQSQQATSTISLPVIQTDAAINPGNSGGALLDDAGRVIGVNVAIASAGGSSDSSGQSGSIGVGFAIPSDLAKRVATEIMQDGQATHGLLGATVRDVTDTNASTLGARIVSVSSGGAAQKAGIAAGDVVTEFNGRPITDATDLTAQVRYLAAGASAKITWVHDGSTQSATVTLGKLTQ